jgi:recombinational DNA repair protein (RecF pathway)
MERHCEGLILSKKGFGEGHLILNFLDSELGKIRLVAYGAARGSSLGAASTTPCITDQIIISCGC